MTTPQTRVGMDEDVEENNLIWTAEEVENAQRQEISQYIESRIDEYTASELKGLDLFEYWKADFENFTAATYKRTTSATKVLRDFLRQNNVYIPKNRLAIGEQLVRSAQNWTPWPIESATPQVQTQTMTPGITPAANLFVTPEGS